MSISERDRFLAIARFERPGDLLMLTPYPNDFWPSTLREWIKQGAPEQILNARFRGNLFQFQHVRILHEISLGFKDAQYEIKLGGGASYDFYTIPPIFPSYEPGILEEDDRTATLVDEAGRTIRIFKGTDKMPMYLDHPVKDRASWEQYKKRLDPDTPERFPVDWNAYVQRINSKDEPVQWSGGGFYWLLREWMGTERLLYTFHDDPALIEDMMEQVCDLNLAYIKRVLKDIRVDWAYFPEDIAFKTGPLISPDMFRKFIMPHYKKITDLLHSYGVDVIEVDSDGNLNELIPLFLDSGINFVWPLEVAAENDIVAIRKKYGKDLIVGGGIDKRALLKGKEAIREEVMSRVPFLLEQGGYFPSVDHLVPPDVTFENYKYFINTMREVAGLEKLPE